MLTSYNGWTASSNRQDIGIVPLTVAGVGFPAGVRGGNVATVLRHVAEQWHARVEPLHDGWCWGYSYRQNRNADNLSCHSSGTAIDLNAPDHPNGKGGTFTARQVAAIRAILAEVDGVCRWGGDFGHKDEMHVEIVGTPAQVAAVAARLRKPPAPPAVSEEDDDMTPAQAKQLAEVHEMLTALVAPRRADHKDTDPQHLSLGDVITADEEDK